MKFEYIMKMIKSNGNSKITANHTLKYAVIK